MTDSLPGRQAQLVLAFVDMADTLVDDYDVLDVLNRLSGYCVSLLDVAAAGLLLADQRGGLQVMAASDERTRLLELLQLQADEGPCLDAFHTGEPVQVDDLADSAQRWPVFVRAALAEGYRSVHAMPLRLRRQVIGALNLFGHQPGQLAVESLQVARALADTATIGILQERAIRRGEVLTEQLQNALTNRVIVEQAKGVIAHAAGVPMSDAFEYLRAYSRNRNVRLSSIAEGLAQGVIAPDVILSQRPPEQHPS